MKFAAFIYAIALLVSAACTAEKKKNESTHDSIGHSFYPEPDRQNYRPSSGGNEIGNGGDVVFCESIYPDKMLGRQIVFLDVYEAHSEYSQELDFGADDIPINMAKRFAERLPFYDGPRKRQLLKAIDEFFDNAELAEDAWFPDIPDSGPVHLAGPDCSLRQIVYQQPPELPGDKLFRIKKDLWEMLPPSDQATLILHEVLYRIASEEFEHVTSRKVRYFISHLLADGVAQMTTEEYGELLDRVQFPRVFYFRNARCHSIRKEPNGYICLMEEQTAFTLKFGTNIGTEYDNVCEVSWVDDGTEEGRVTGVECEGNQAGLGSWNKNNYFLLGPFDFQRAEFYPDESLKVLYGFEPMDTVGCDYSHPSVDIDQFHEGQISHVQYEDGYRVCLETHGDLEGRKMEFHPDGFIKSIQQTSYDEICFDEKGESTFCDYGLRVGCDRRAYFKGDLEFHDTHMLASGTLGEDAELCTASGALKMFHANDQLAFDKDGRVL